jgi:hypothetical protein
MYFQKFVCVLRPWTSMLSKIIVKPHVAPKYFQLCLTFIGVSPTTKSSDPVLVSLV